MGHALNWTPGNHGKGIVTPEGDAHTWNIDRQDGTPIHQEYIEKVLGVPETNPYSEYNAFEIGPEGPDDIDKLDPRLVPTNKWRFQSVAESPVQVVDVNHPVKDEPHAPAYCEGPLDKPFAYDPVARTVYLGQPGGYHTDMAPYIPSNDDPMKWPQGRLRNPHTETNPYTDEVEHTPMEADWFTKPPENHEEIHRALGAAPLSGKWVWYFNRGARVAENDEKWQLVKIGMPVGEDYWNQFVDPGHGMEPGYWYHGTSPNRLESIMQHGIHPWDSDIAGGTNYKDNSWLKPRPGHVYMAQHPRDARDRGLDSTVEDRGPRSSPLVLRVDPAYLDPQHINPDEDRLLPNGDTNGLGRKYPSQGELAESMGYGDVPSETEREIDRGGHIGYRGVIPPQALTPGTYDNGQWQPIEWPHTAALIGDMRDGWGRFAVTAPWQPGSSGKGIYYPDTGVLQTWGDDRNHSDVWFDDENASQGDAHHIVIRPNGTVYDQGCMDRNFENAEGDVPGLQQALKELDPRLQLDSSNTWSFGPTEPMESEPSSVSRGEDGGSIHGVQTGSDFVGSL